MNLSRSFLSWEFRSVSIAYRNLRSCDTDSGSGLSLRRPGPRAGRLRLLAEGSALRSCSDSTGRRQIPHATEGSWLAGPGCLALRTERVVALRRSELFKGLFAAQAITPALTPAAGRFPAPPSLVFVFIRFGVGGGRRGLRGKYSCVTSTALSLHMNVLFTLFRLRDSHRS